jgi:hypothetical protein
LPFHTDALPFRLKATAMNFSSFPLVALLVLADAIGRIDYAAADMEAAREAIRDAVAAAIAAQRSPALPSDADGFPAADQARAMTHGWCMVACGDGQLVIEADSDQHTFGSNAAAYDHVAAVAEAVSYRDGDYQELCQRALALADDTAADSDALPSDDETVTRTVTIEDLGPQAQAVARHALEVGADRVTISTMGAYYWYRGTELRRPDETYEQWAARIDPRN